MNMKPPTGYHTCRRCHGKGEYLSYGVCFACNGARFVPNSTAVESRPHVSPERGMKAIEAIRDESFERDGYTNGPVDCETSYARGALESLEPTRFVRLVESVEAGRIKAVVDHLLVYYQGVASS